MSFIKVVILISILLTSSLTLSAQSFTKVASTKPLLVQKGQEKKWCCVCGMNLKMFYKTSHIAKLQDKTARQYCSMRCLVVDMKKHKIDIDAIKVIDASTQKPIDAKDAFYVLGSKVKGTMSRVSKLAFASKDDAQKFVKKHRGRVVSFDEALKSAQNSLASDMAMIKMKKEKKIYPMGKKIFTKMCSKDIDAKEYKAINELKAAIKNQKLCKPLKEKQLQVVSLYLWEVKRFATKESLAGQIRVTKDEKCPICGMFIYKYPKWAAQIFYGDKHYSFDGVKDMIKYYFEHKELKSKISKILVSDYYSQKAIEARESYFVMGSDVYGPMGDELIPFAKKQDAKTFSMDHKGIKIMKFKDISKEEVYKLDE